MSEKMCPCGRATAEACAKYDEERAEREEPTFEEITQEAIRDGQR